MSTTEATTATPATPKPTFAHKAKAAYSRLKGKVHDKVAHSKNAKAPAKDTLEPTVDKKDISQPQAGSALTGGLAAPSAAAAHPTASQEAIPQPPPA